jgi:hypothetical protein
MPPFKSESQRKLLWAKHPEVARKWADKYGTPKNLPEHVKPKPDAKKKK